MWNKEVTLVKKVFDGKDSLGQPIVKTKKTTILAQEKSITNSILYYAMQLGFKPTLMVHIHAFEYDKESLLECDGIQYVITRAVQQNAGELIELQCEEVGATQHGIVD